MATEIPLWLDYPPDGDVPAPPVDTRKQTLPYNQLSWHNFERLLIRLIRLDSKILGCEAFGTPGQAQEGIDILAISDKDPTIKICFQCKKVEKFSATDIRNAVEKFLGGNLASDCREFVLCVSVPLEDVKQVSAIATQRQRLQQKNIKLRIWDGSECGELSVHLKTSPTLVDDFFGRAWVESFNGHQEASKLGSRLDAVDSEKLKGRLKALYTSLFNQHDPGIRGSSGHINYIHRYVSADIIETSRFKASRIKNNTGPSGLSLDENPVQALDVTVSTMNNVYETRRGVFGWLNEHKSCVVLGEAGYGKSALLRHLALALLHQDQKLVGQLSSDKLALLPIWISFPAFSSAIARKHSTSLQDHFHEWLHQNGFDDVQPLFDRSVNHSNLLLLIDGLDEATDLSQAQQALDRIVLFAESTQAELICTSRPLGFNSLGVPSNWPTTNLAALSDTQISELSARWFALTECVEGEEHNAENTQTHSRLRAEAFLAAVRVNARTCQLARVPLLCQSLIELFRNSHRLPEERQAIYDEIISLLLSRHPTARIRASGVAASGDILGISTRDIREILIRLAWHMQFNGRIVVEKLVQLERVCSDYLNDGVTGLGLSRSDADRTAHLFIATLVSRFGILVEKAPKELGFVHLSIQEYLAAESVCRKTETDQIKWIESIWKQPVWRECLINWFGILGAQGKKAQIGSAAGRIAEMGQEGEFERIQSLELRAELACADIGLPIFLAREIITEVKENLSTSPFLLHRIRLAKYLTVGALGLTVQDECRDIICRLITGRDIHQRSSIFTSLAHWAPSPELKFTLLQGMRDENFVCRKSAAESFAHIFAESEDAKHDLQNIALYEQRPQVRAAALRALGAEKKWAENALDCANKNLSSACSELLLEAVKIRVSQLIHDDSDLETMSRLRYTHSIDFWQEKEFFDTLYRGWPAEDSIKKAIFANAENLSWSPHLEGEFTYLMRSYPGNDEVAELLANRLKSKGLHFVSDAPNIWPIMRENFRGHPLLVPILQEQLAKHYEEFQLIHWHPNNVGGYTVIGDSDTRDRLLSAYTSAKGRTDRYWISHALVTGWATDDKVINELSSWAEDSIEFSAPLARHSKFLYKDISKRRAWLEKIIANADDHNVSGALYEFLEQFSDKKGRALIRARLETSKLWYYTTTDIESRYAASDPSDPFSSEIIFRSLNELDGPHISNWAAKVEKNQDLRDEVLKACTPAPDEVRLSIVATLRERLADSKTLSQLAPYMLAEINGGVRSTLLIAFAQAAKADNENLLSLQSKLSEELKSQGTYYIQRRRSALAGLIELGCASFAVKTLEDSKQKDWINNVADGFNPDPVSLNHIVSNWAMLRPLLEESNLSTQWPLNEIVYEGLGSVLEQSPDLKGELDKHLRSYTKHVKNDGYFELLSKKYPKSDFLKSSLIECLKEGYGRSVRGLCIMRLLATQFGSDVSALNSIISALTSFNFSSDSNEDGVFGYLMLGWHGKEFESLLNDFKPMESTKLRTRDQLLISISNKDEITAEKCAKSLLSEPLNNWTYRAEDTQLLLLWANNDISNEPLQRWARNENPTLSATAISLMNDCGKLTSIQLNEIKDRFNKSFENLSPAVDGFDAVFRQNRGWCHSAYLTLISEKDTYGHTP